MNAPAASSPCIKICTMKPASALCMGCGRTVDEIAAWWRMSEGERLKLMAELPARLLDAQRNS